MGISIHFQGTLKNTTDIKSLVDELIEISDILKWKWHVLDEDWSKPSTAKLTEFKDRMEITGLLSLKGISISLHKDCEPLSLFFDSQGTLTLPMTVVLVNEGTIEKKDSYSFVKTQFAPVDVHISIIRLLKYLKKRYIPNLQVVDEGEYWESEDKELLLKKRAFIKDKLDMLEGVLSDIELENDKQYTAEQLTDILEERLKKL